MRHENARVGKGGLGAARKRRRRRIDASTPGPRERNGKITTTKTTIGATGAHNQDATEEVRVASVEYDQ
ncbi:hypothetical protein ALC62_01603 [Cyphomyrmex costatus]|uniref:Uncharacterized protein n=1 Tax=Cyphomyrmex costatus TaxID=456900 RepID=A0A195D3G6_9HYME|nr:hypothetical protein ALC62_01603 [Cyphomyrmex costatus]